MEHEKTPTKWQLAQNEHIVRVTYRDTDKMGVAYYANYLVWFEIGRTELLRETGHTYREFEQLGYALPVTRCVCEYKKPARYDDLIRIVTRIEKLSGASVVFRYQIFREATGELLAQGETKHALVDRDGKIARAGNVLKGWFGEAEGHKWE